MRSTGVRLPSPAMAVALLALFVALGGTGYAASQLPGGNGDALAARKKAPSESKQDKRAFYTKAQSNRRFLAVKGTALKALSADSATNATHAPYIDKLPSGKSLRGVYAIRGTEANLYGFISFPHRLAAAPSVHVIPMGTASPPQCPGTLSDPQAQSGNLCIYENNAGITSTFDPADPSAGPGAGPMGTVLYSAGPAGLDRAPYGSWAVTG